VGNGVRDGVDVDNVLDELHVFWSLLWLMMFKTDIWKADLDVPLLVFLVKAGSIKNSLRYL
jgi:hypothetical protein